MHIRPFASFIVILFLLASGAFANLPVGWRTDGTGRYPDAKPPHSWGPDKNVAWRTPMATFSNAIPVIVGDKIFTCAEPCVLICLNKADGKILWQRECSYDDLNIAPDVKQQFEIQKRHADEWDHQRLAVEKEMSVLQKQVREKTLAQEQADPKLKELRVQQDELRKKVAALPAYSRYSKPYMQPTGGVSMCTPVCDGQQIYVGYGNGLVACYDMEGNRQWLKLIEHSTAAYGHASSPVLVGGKLLVHYADLVALNVKDGSEIWRDKIPPKHGTSIPFRIGDVDVILHPGGRIIRVDDGKILADKLGENGENSPIVQDGIAYWLAGQGRAVRLPKSIDEKPEILWKNNYRGGGYWFSSPVYYEGLLYLINANRSFSVIDAVTGKLVYEMKLEVGGQVYPSIAMAGGVIYISSDTGETVLLQPGREYHEIGRNRLETFRSTPVFEGRRMYVRTSKFLYCIEEPAAGASAAEPAPIYRTAPAPKIDGSLDDSCWKRAAPVVVNYLYGSEGKRTDPAPMTARFAWDEKYLYIGYEVLDTDLVTVPTGRETGPPGNRRPTSEEYAPEKNLDLVEFFVIFDNPRAFWEIHHTAGNEMNNHWCEVPPADVLAKIAHPSINNLTIKRDGYIPDAGDATVARAVQLMRRPDGTLSTINKSDDIDVGYTGEIRLPWAGLGVPANRRRADGTYDLSGMQMSLLAAVLNGNGGKPVYHSSADLPKVMFHFSADHWPRYILK